MPGQGQIRRRGAEACRSAPPTRHHRSSTRATGIEEYPRGGSPLSSSGPIVMSRVLALCDHDMAASAARGIRRQSAMCDEHRFQSYRLVFRRPVARSAILCQCDAKCKHECDIVFHSFPRRPCPKNRARRSIRSVQAHSSSRRRKCANRDSAQRNRARTVRRMRGRRGRESTTRRSARRAERPKPRREYRRRASPLCPAIASGPRRR